MKAYALDLRERVVKFIQNGDSKTKVARRFEPARSSVYRYLVAPLVFQGSCNTEVVDAYLSKCYCRNCRQAV